MEGCMMRRVGRNDDDNDVFDGRRTDVSDVGSTARVIADWVVGPHVLVLREIGYTWSSLLLFEI